MEDFYTLPQKTVSEQSIEKSRFIGIGVPVNTPQQINQEMQTIQDEFPNARHYVYAYRLHDGKLEKSSDDGEPQGTGGRPILDVLQHHNIWNGLLVVVRYFGGILLGTGGLTRAYSSTAKQVVSGVDLVKLSLYQQFQLRIPYEWYKILKYQFEQQQLLIISEEFSDVINTVIRVPADKKEDFRTWFADLTRNQVNIEDQGVSWG